MRELIGKVGFVLIALFFGFVWLDLMAALLLDDLNSVVIGIMAEPRSGPGILALCYLILAGLMALADPEEW